ncbi:hypothetical protein LEMLEM_LOCUS11991, partial [Lemmus lemmus]
ESRGAGRDAAARRGCLCPRPPRGKLPGAAGKSLRLKTDVNTECQSPERKGASFAQSGEQWPLKPRRCRKRGAGSQFLQVRRTQQAVQLHPPCIFLHIARA